MSRQRIPPGLFARDQGGQRRYYARLNGRRVALCATEQTRATTDVEVAKALFAQLTADDQKRTLRGVHGLPEPVALATYTQEHLVKKAQANRVTDQALAADERHLKRACAFLGDGRDLLSIDVPAVTGWIAMCWPCSTTDRLNRRLSARGERSSEDRMGR